MAADCPDCGAPAARTRPATRSSGLPIRLRVNGATAPLSAFVCVDCGRVRFTTNVTPGDATCSVCSGSAATGRVRTPSEELRLLAGEDGADRARVRATACADCGAVELRTTGVAGAAGTTCPVCRQGMVRTTPAVGADRVDFAAESRGGGPDLAAPVDPLAWACTDCGLVLVYDRQAGEAAGD